MLDMRRWLLRLIPIALLGVFAWGSAGCRPADPSSAGEGSDVARAAVGKEGGGGVTERRLLTGGAVLSDAAGKLSGTATAKQLKAMTRVAKALASASAAGRPRIVIDYPLADAVFPADIVAPVVRWHDPSDASLWMIEVSFPASASRAPLLFLVDGTPPPSAPKAPPLVVDGNPFVPTPYPAEEYGVYEPSEYVRSGKGWRPSRPQWEAIKAAASGSTALLRVAGLGPDGDGPRTLGSVRIGVSKDPVGAPIFFRDVPLPFIHALKNLRLIRWRLGDISSDAPPRTMLQNLRACGNCHSFSRDGRVLGMDVDYANDKGSYVITEVGAETVLDSSKVITWMDYEREDGQATFGLLSQISPDGRYAVSTVKDSSVFVPVPDLTYSQRFFPVRGVLVAYDRERREFTALKGADDPLLVQSNPSWTADGSALAFTRAEAYELKGVKAERGPVIRLADASEFFEGGKKFRYDLYRLPFNEGRGGVAQAIPGGSANGRSNYFARYSPDGRWLVFCQADSFMLLQKDSELFIMPAEGGTPRRMRANFAGKMNSWHSWSPNSRWLVFASKANGPYTQLWLTHVDERGQDSPPVLLEHFATADRAANIPEFVNLKPSEFGTMREAFEDYYTYFRAGEEYQRHGENDLAMEQYRSAIHLKPDFGPAHGKLAFLLRLAGHNAESLKHFREAVRLEPGNAWLRADMARTLAAMGRVEESNAALDEALRHVPDKLDQIADLGQVVLELGRTKDALRLFQRAATGDPRDADYPVHVGVALSLLGRMDEGLAAFRRALEIDPGNRMAQHNIGRTLEQQGKKEEALAAYRAAVKLDSRAADTRLNLALLLLSLGRSADALPHLEAAADLVPQDGGVLDLLLGVYRRSGAKGKLIERLGKALEANPGEVRLANDLAWELATAARADLRDGERAVRLATQACQATGFRFVPVLETLAAAQAEAGNYEEAVRVAQRAIDVATAEHLLHVVPVIEERLRLYQARKPFHQGRASDADGPVPRRQPPSGGR